MRLGDNPCTLRDDFRIRRKGGLRARPPSLRICFHIKGSKLNLLPRETRICRQNSLHRNADGDGRGSVIDWHARSTDDWGTAQDLWVHHHNVLGCVKTLEPLFHFLVEWGQIDRQKFVLDGLGFRRRFGRPRNRPLPLFRSQPVRRPEVERDQGTGLALERPGLGGRIEPFGRDMLVDHAIDIAHRDTGYESGFR